MQGCRPLSREEVQLIHDSFTGRYATRNRCLFVLGVLAGFRIKEMLSLRVKDVVANKKIRSLLRVARRNMKGSQKSRTVYLAREAQLEILHQVHALQWPGQDVFLFRAQGNKNKAISYTQARRVLLDAFTGCGVADQVGTHSLRKTFANELFEFMLGLLADGEQVEPFMEVSTALGHSDPKSTKHYLSFRDAARRRAIKNMGARLSA
ncbi:integrase [Marinifilum sp. JC120]|nr:integrase [Marinifilum sp. JC120]